MQKNSVVAKYIYGTSVIAGNTDYDIDDMCMIVENTDTAVCNNDCVNCVIECPYKSY